MFYLADGRSRLYQWDTGVKLFIDNSIGQTIDEVHFSTRFSNENFSVAVTHEETEHYAFIPNILLTKSYDITVYAYCRTENSAYTNYTEVFEVEARPKPADYVYTETECLKYNDLEEKIDTLADDLSKTEEEWANQFGFIAIFGDEENEGTPWEEVYEAYQNGTLRGCRYRNYVYSFESSWSQGTDYRELWFTLAKQYVYKTSGNQSISMHSVYCTSLGEWKVSNASLYTRKQTDEAIAEAKDIFIATYNETPYAEVEAAYQAGKHILMKAKSTSGSSSYLVPMYDRTSGTVSFRLMSKNFERVWYCQPKGWRFVETPMATKAQLDEHAAQHAVDGTDPITPKMIGAMPAFSGEWEEIGTYGLSTGTKSYGSKNLDFGDYGAIRIDIEGYGDVENPPDNSNIGLEVGYVYVNVTPEPLEEFTGQFFIVPWGPLKFMVALYTDHTPGWSGHGMGIASSAVVTDWDGPITSVSPRLYVNGAGISISVKVYGMKG